MMASISSSSTVISPRSLPPQDLTSLLQQLDELEFEIDKLLSKQQSALPMFLIDARLTQLSQLVAGIPETKSRLVCEWNRRLAKLTTRKEKEFNVGAPERPIVDDANDSISATFEKTASQHQLPPKLTVIAKPTDHNIASSSPISSPPSEFVQRQETKSLDRELGNLEFAIKRLYASAEVGNDPLPLGLLKPKFVLFAELIERIPKQYSELADNWNQRLASLMDQYQSLIASKESRFSPVKASSTLNPKQEAASVLARDLHQLESSIVVLLSTRSSSSKSLPELDTKLAKLMQMIATVPSEHHQLATEWSDKAALLMEKYMSIEEIGEEANGGDIETTEEPVLVCINSGEKAKEMLEVAAEPVCPPTMMTSRALDELMDNLNTLASDILRMLSMESVEPKLSKKLAEFDRCVAMIPDSDTKLAELSLKWSKKAAELRQQYVAFVMAAPAIESIGLEYHSAGESSEYILPPQSCETTDSKHQSESTRIITLTSRRSPQIKDAASPQRRQQSNPHVCNQSPQREHIGFSYSGTAPNDNHGSESGNRSLAQELNQLECSITKLLNVRPRPHADVDAKMAELMQSIGTIPSENADLANLWTDKMVALLEQYNNDDDGYDDAHQLTSCTDQPMVTRSNSLEELHRLMEADEDSAAAGFGGIANRPLPSFPL